MGNLIVDTNAWIDYLNGDGRLKETLDGNILETPMSVVMEIFVVLRREGHSEEVRKKALNSILNKSTVVPLEVTDAERVSDLVINSKLHFADALAYAGASQDKHFLTADPDFKGKPFVQWTR